MPATARARSLALLLGLAAGFAGAVFEGHRAAHYSKPSGFRRLHQRISPESSFYPPFSMLENLALARWQPGKTVVIIGGNSVLEGAGQSADHLWSLRLQELLGDRYVVVNLAFSGAYPSEGGALVAESLLKRHIPVLYVANAANGPQARPYESTYGWLFWDARAHDRLLFNPARTAELDLRFTSALPVVRAQLRTSELSARLNALLGFEELWHHVAYRHFSTIWTFVTRDRFWRPRQDFPDWGPDAPPPDQRYRDNFDVEMIITRGASQTFAEPDGQGGWRAAAGPLHQADIDIEEIFPQLLRPRMLLLLSQSSPYYRDRLTPEERARDTFVFRTYEQVWRRHGIHAVIAGSDFTADDFADRIHLAPAGGQKLAELVARELRQLHSP
ncbi:MAG TPA: hypothetical protein VL200_11025 [Lacunisphaera sp.]|jgi:hypothetical protein|nr:hypothetical protein [Lacunisphaera sp.]